MVVRMAEDQHREEAKQRLRFFKNGKDTAQRETPSEPAISAARAVGIEEAPPANTEAVPSAARPEARGGEPAVQEPRALNGDSGARTHDLGAGGEDIESRPDESKAAVEERRAAVEEPRLAAGDVPAGDRPGAGAHRSRRRERVQPQESRPEPKETLKSQLLPSLALGFRTLVILAIIVADAFAAYMLTTKVIAPKLIESKVVDLRAEIGQLPPEGGVLPAAKPRKPPRGQDAVGSMFQIKDIVVNPSGTNGTRYLCTTVALEISDPLVEKEATAREAQVRDLLIEILSRRTVTELSSLEMRDHIRDEIGRSVNTLLTSGNIDGVYFSNFVLQ
jgi:flagellar basal body-associated protein FliL